MLIGKYLYYYSFTEEQKNAVADFLDDSITRDSFIEYNGRWYISYAEITSDFIEDFQEEYGDSFPFKSEYWTLSTVPSVLRP